MELRNSYITENDNFFFINIWVTLYCNYKCKYCYETSDKPNMYMSVDTADDVVKFIINETKKENCNSIWINFHGGEPSLNTLVIKHIVERISEEMPEHKLHTSMTTNCSTFNESICDYISELTVSLDGIGEAHDLNRITRDGKGTFENSMINALKYLEIYKDELRLRTVITPNNVEYVAEGIEYLYSLGFRIIVPGIDYFSDQWTEELFDILYEQFCYIKKFYNTCEPKTLIGLIDDPISPKGKCYVGCDGSNVSVDGKLYSCTYVVGEKEYCIGDVCSGTDEEKIGTINCLNKKEVEECKDCNYYNYCTSPRCLILNKKLTGDYYTPSAIVCAEENLKLKVKEYKI